MKHTTIAQYLQVNHRKLFSVYSLVDNFNYQKKRREFQTKIKISKLRRDINFLCQDKNKAYDDNSIYAYSPTNINITINSYQDIVKPIFSNEFDCIDYCFNNSLNIIGVYVITKNCIFRKVLTSDTLRGNLLKIKSNCQLQLKEIINLS